MTIPQHPLNPAWLAIETEVVGNRLINSWEAAAMKALTTFCEQHPLEVILAPAGLFLAVSKSDPLMAGQICISRPLGRSKSSRDHTLQALQSKGMTQLIDLAQSFQWAVNLRDEQMQDLVEEIGDRDARIGQLEGQVQTLETTVGEHEAMIEFLEEQIHVLNIDLEDANGHIDLHHTQQAALHVPPDVMDIDSDEEPEEIEGVSDLDYGVVIPQPAQMGAHYPARSESSVNNLDDY
jgi:hypothetical protein